MTVGVMVSAIGGVEGSGISMWRVSGGALGWRWWLWDTRVRESGPGAPGVVVIRVVVVRDEVVRVRVVLVGVVLARLVLEERVKAARVNVGAGVASSP